MALLFSGEKSDVVIGRLERLFLTNPVSIERTEKFLEKNVLHAINLIT
jgi:hypothetical protein